MAVEEIIVGTVVKPHGVRGELIVDYTTDFPEERFQPGQSVRLRNDRGVESLTIHERRFHKGRLIVEFEEISDRNQAEEYRDTDVVIDENDVLGRDGDLYDFDLIGMVVYDEDENNMGEIISVSRDRNPASVKIKHRDGTIEFPIHQDLVISSNRSKGWLQLQFPRGWRKLIID